MKKGLFILSLLCFSAWMMAQEAEPVLVAADTVPVDSLKGVHPYDLKQNEKGISPKIAHWSIIPHIGFSAFDGDFTHEMKHNIAVPTAGLAIEYSFTPVWNVGVEYMYDMYTVTGRTGGNRNNADTLLLGHMHKAGAYLSMDLINLFFPRVKKKIVSIFPYIGTGAAWYKRARYFKDDNYVNPTHGRGNTLDYINADGENAPDKDKHYHMEGYIQAGVNVDFNLNRTLALGLRANYTYFTRDYFDGRGYSKGDAAFASNNNDGIFDITLNMRFKLEAVSKSHPRNMPSFEAYDKMVAKAAPMPLAVHDTVIIRHDSIIVREIIREEKVKMPPRIYNVYFDNDKANLRQDAQATIQEAAMVMEEDPSLYAVVIGYCDNTGSKAHNYELGDRRSVNVSEELAEEYGIPVEHIYNAGVGKVAARKSTKSFGPNRRVSIHLVDKETFELMKLEVDDKNSVRNVDENEPVVYDKANTVRVPKLDIEEEKEEPVETVPLSESSRKEEEYIQQLQKRTHEIITTEKGATLAKLARQYYNNTMCWVYIFMANSDKLQTPNALQDGQEIMIPELTQEELKTTMAECLRLYSITAHRNAAK